MTPIITSFCLLNFIVTKRSSNERMFNESLSIMEY